jgi:hypothetical protein
MTNPRILNKLQKNVPHARKGSLTAFVELPAAAQMDVAGRLAFD